MYQTTSYQFSHQLLETNMTSTDKGTKSKRPDLKKEVQTKDDGRLLIFYTCSDSKQIEKKQEARK
jgi:hypothetical protein